MLTGPRCDTSTAQISSQLAKQCVNATILSVACVEMVLEAKMQETEVVETEQHTPQSLTAADRCDSCGAQAYVRATLQFGELLFCLHHATLNKQALEPVTVNWHDESEKLLAR